MTTLSTMHSIIAALGAGRNLAHEEAVRAFQVIMNGGATPAQMAAFLMGLKLKRETVEEITAGAEVLRAKMTRFDAPQGCIDTCGTGGDGRNTYNISTAVALVLAACGLPVAKHGNRAVSSASGSADVLSALGVRLDADNAIWEKCLREYHFCFLLAPRFHSAMRHVAPVRQELGIRTIFNLLGPLSNPAQPDYQLLGVFDARWLEGLAQALNTLGLKRAWVVHGNGTDELSLSGVNQVVELKDGALTRFEFTAQDAGLDYAPLEALKGGDAAVNAAALKGILLGEKNAYRDTVLLNAAAGLIIAGNAADLREGVQMAAAALDEGKAYRVLMKVVEVSNQ